MERIRPRIEQVKIVNPLGQYCAQCRHFVMDPTPNATQGKCVRYPPVGDLMKNSHGQVTGLAGVRPPIQNPQGDWCGEWAALPAAVQ